MNKIFIFILAGSAMLFSSCSKKSEDASSQQTYLELTVLDGNSYSATASGLTGVSGALVALYTTLDDVANNNPVYTTYTYSGGVVDIPITNYKSTLYLVVKKGTASNIYKSLLVSGVFQSQTEIQQSAVQTPAGTVGSVKFADLDRNGIIDQNDQTTADVVTLAEHSTTSKTSVIYQDK